MNYSWPHTYWDNSRAYIQALDISTDHPVCTEEVLPPYFTAVLDCTVISATLLPILPSILAICDPPIESFDLQLANSLSTLSSIPQNHPQCPAFTISDIEIVVSCWSRSRIRHPKSILIILYFGVQLEERFQPKKVSFDAGTHDRNFPLTCDCIVHEILED